MKGLRIKGKLVLCFSLLITCIILVESCLSFWGLRNAYSSTLSIAEERFDVTIKTAVENIISVLNINHQRYLDGELTEREAMENARKIVRDARYSDGTGYFWADMADGKCVVHPNPDYEGTERYNNQDLNGTYFIQNLISAGNNKNGDFTEFYFTKPNEEGSFRKKAFTQKFEPYGWYISTGNYYDDMKKLTDQYHDAEMRNLYIILIFSGTSLALSILIVRILANKITNPLTKITDRLVSLSQGDLNMPVPEIDTHDETQILAEATKNTVNELSAVINDLSLNLSQFSNGNFTMETAHQYKKDMIPIKDSMLRIKQSLNDTLMQIDVSADQVSSGSEQVSKAAQTLAQGAAEQTSSIDLLSTTVSEVSAKVKDNATNAMKASQKAVHVNTVIEVGDKQFEELITAMNNISSSSREIEKIIKNIDDISFQTNILALNAAVEAARAGEAGKGFAVVADEVRNLASKSAEAAQNTTLLIEAAIEAIEKGTHIVQSTTETFESVVTNTKEITFEIDKVSIASNEQAQAIENITEGLDQISTIIQSNSAIAQESAAASEELSGQARMLKDLIGKFELTGAKSPF